MTDLEIQEFKTIIGKQYYKKRLIKSSEALALVRERGLIDKIYNYLFWLKWRKSMVGKH